MLNLIDELKKIGYGFLFVAATIFIYIYFGFDVYDRIGYLIIWAALFNTYTYIKSRSIFNIWKFFINVGHIIIFISLLTMTARLGVFGYLGSILLVCFLILYKKWSKYIEVKQHIESMIWGKPLKDFIKEGKKPPKIEIN